MTLNVQRFVATTCIEFCRVRICVPFDFTDNSQWGKGQSRGLKRDDTGEHRLQRCGIKFVDGKIGLPTVAVMLLIKPNELCWYYSRKIIILAPLLSANVGICINASSTNWRRVATFCLFVVQVTTLDNYVTVLQSYWYRNEYYSS